jgi:Tfp pilus assembly protein PilN
MRAINLLPADLRGAAPSAPSARPEPVQGIGAYAVLGVLALCVALLAVYVLATNSVKQKQTDLADVTTQATAASQRAAQLKPYADFQALAKARVETVRGLAAARFDWEQALRDLSRVIPGDVKLTTLNGDMGLPGTTGSGGDPLRGSIQAPAVSLAGCAASQASVARLMARLRGVDGVTRVSLSKSETSEQSGGGTQASACEGAEPPSFSVVVFFEGSAAAAALASTGVDASSVPVPSALDKPAAGTAPEDGSAPASQDATASTEQDSASGTTTNTNTTTSGATAP